MVDWIYGSGTFRQVSINLCGFLEKKTPYTIELRGSLGNMPGGVSDRAANKSNFLFEFYHPRMRRGSTFKWSHLSVCLSVCLQCSNFWKPWRRKFVFGTQVHLWNLKVKFIFQGQWDKVKVTGTKIRGLPLTCLNWVFLSRSWSPKL